MKIQFFSLGFVIYLELTAADSFPHDDGTDVHREEDTFSALDMRKQEQMQRTEHTGLRLPKVNWPYIGEECCNISTTPKCLKKGGNCIPRNATCDGDVYRSRKYCDINKLKSCQCCVPRAQSYETYPGQVWSPSQCPYLEYYTDLSPEDCKIKCTEDVDCTAVNFVPGNGFCRKLKCPKPVPEPTESNPWTGYAKVSESRCKLEAQLNGTLLRNAEDRVGMSRQRIICKFTGRPAIRTPQCPTCNPGFQDFVKKHVYLGNSPLDDRTAKKFSGKARGGAQGGPPAYDRHGNFLKHNTVFDGSNIDIWDASPQCPNYCIIATLTPTYQCEAEHGFWKRCYPYPGKTSNCVVAFEKAIGGHLSPISMQCD